MYFSEEEKQLMRPLFLLIDGESKSRKFEMTLQDRAVLLADFDTSYETDNGAELDDEDEGYEEFHACLFVIKEVYTVSEENKEKYKPGEFLEITYHNVPREIKPV